MTEPTMLPDERYMTLVNRAVDGVLTEAERRELDERHATNPEGAAELEDLLAMKVRTDALMRRIQSTATIEPPRPGVRDRAVIRFGMLATLGGFISLTVLALMSWFVQSDLPAHFRWATGLLWLGLGVLTAYVWSVQRRAAKSDPYEEIDR